MQDTMGVNGRTLRLRGVFLRGLFWGLYFLLLSILIILVLIHFNADDTVIYCSAPKLHQAVSFTVCFQRLFCLNLIFFFQIQRNKQQIYYQLQLHSSGRIQESWFCI